MSQHKHSEVVFSPFQSTKASVLLSLSVIMPL